MLPLTLNTRIARLEPAETPENATPSIPHWAIRKETFTLTKDSSTEETRKILDTILDGQWLLNHLCKQSYKISCYGWIVVAVLATTSLITVGLALGRAAPQLLKGHPAVVNWPVTLGISIPTLLLCLFSLKKTKDHQNIAKLLTAELQQQQEFYHQAYIAKGLLQEDLALIDPELAKKFKPEWINLHPQYLHSVPLIHHRNHPTFNPRFHCQIDPHYYDCDHEQWLKQWKDLGFSNLKKTSYPEFCDQGRLSFKNAYLGIHDKTKDSESQIAIWISENKESLSIFRFAQSSRTSAKYRYFLTKGAFSNEKSLNEIANWTTATYYPARQAHQAPTEIIQLRPKCFLDGGYPTPEEWWEDLKKCNGFENLSSQTANPSPASLDYAIKKHPYPQQAIQLNHPNILPHPTLVMTFNAADLTLTLTTLPNESSRQLTSPLPD